MLGLRVLPEHGGQNHDCLTAGLVMEEVARGDFNCAAVVFAKTDPASGARGISTFLVPLDRPGITRHPYPDMGALDGAPHTKEAAMCKMQAPDIATAVIHDCLILHGHYGYTQDHAVEQRLRDVIG